MKNIFKNKVVDIYEGEEALASALLDLKVDQVTLYKQIRNKNSQNSNVTLRPYNAILETADCVADICFLDNRAIKVLVAMYPSAPTFVLVPFAFRTSWFIGIFGLLRRVISGLVRVENIITININKKKTRWIVIKQKGMPSHKIPSLPNKIGIPKFLEWMKKENINYVVLRFYEKLPALYRSAGDIDLLLPNADKEKVNNYLRKNKHLQSGVSKDIRLGLHTVSGEKGSISYYPPKLAAEILDHAIDGPAGSRIPSPEYALKSFIYHCLYHAKKGYAAGIPSSLKKYTEQHPENDYLGVIKKMAQSLNINPGNTMEELDEFLAHEGWRPKLDTLSKLGDTNAWVYDRFFALGQGGPIGLAVFMLREWVYEKKLANKVIDVIKQNGFVIIREKVLTGKEKQRASEILRGGSWGQNSDGSNKGWLPAVALVVVDMKCVKMPPAYAKGYEHFKIRNLKNILRKMFDTKELGAVHSTDNAHQSWEYIDICFPEEAKDIRAQFETLAKVSFFSRLSQFFSPTYLRHSLQYSLRQFFIRKFLS